LKRAGLDTGYRFLGSPGITRSLSPIPALLGYCVSFNAAASMMVVRYFFQKETASDEAHQVISVLIPEGVFHQ
jgi:hypothetical protein